MGRSEGPDPSAADFLLKIKGIGPARLRLLACLGIRGPEDALLHLPRRYEDRRLLRSIGELRDGETASVRGEVRTTGTSYSRRRGRRIFEVKVADDSGELRARWFHHRGLAQSPLFRPGRSLYLFGTVRRTGSARDMIHPEVEAADGGADAVHFEDIVPLYPTTEGLPQRLLRTLMGRIVEASLPGVEEFLPMEVRVRQGLCGRAEALRALHRPPPELPVQALNAWETPWHRRLIFEELLLLQLGLERRRLLHRRARKGSPVRRREETVRTFVGSLPFRLTPAQEKVYREISADMMSPRCMQRLLQGDVGSGKTVVATMACLLAVENGCQAAWMAPTEILAEQHFLTAKRLTNSLNLRIALLTSGSLPRQRRQVAEVMGSGAVDLVVGTHSLIQSSVRFRRLGLVVIDEQHRFGVRQRLALWKKGEHPDMLVMTATPIPRTLALAFYGDLDQSVMEMLPPGRLPVETLVRTETQRPAVYDEVRCELAEGGRAFIVLPFIEEDGANDLRTVLGAVDHLRREAFPGHSVGVVHGRMALAEREEAMKDFRTGRVSVLAATTVIEVGVDVPEATRMLIEHAERFGLSQLHQLRGRIGRGRRSSRCYLMVGERVGEQARRRLDIVSATVDGFGIAEADLSLRGPGELAGARQSGLPRLQVADVSRDREILLQAREEAAALLSQDEDLAAPEHQRLRQLVNMAWKGKFHLAAAG